MQEVKLTADQVLGLVLAGMQVTAGIYGIALSGSLGFVAEAIAKSVGNERPDYEGLAAALREAGLEALTVEGLLQTVNAEVQRQNALAEEDPEGLVEALMRQLEEEMEESGEDEVVEAIDA